MRERIEEEIEQCRKDIERLEVTAAPISPDKAIGRISRMDSMNDQGIASAALSQAREKMHKLQQALDRVESPSFGLCVMCGRPIPIERLMVLPESTHCVSCAR